MKLPANIPIRLPITGIGINPPINRPAMPPTTAINPAKLEPPRFVTPNQAAANSATSTRMERMRNVPIVHSPGN